MLIDPNDVHTIERIPATSAEVFRARYLDPGRPVIMTGVANGWKALERWTSDYLRTVETKADLPVDVYSDGDFFQIGGALNHRNRVHMSLGEYIDRSLAETTTAYYAPDLAFSKYFPRLNDDFVRPSTLPADVRNRTYFFAGNNAITAGHFHPFTHAFTCQVIGTKRFVLYPPNADGLYPYPWFSPAFYWSKVDLLHPDFERFPKLRGVRSFEFTLEPGDAIFIPVHWWHWTQGVDFSISVLFSWTAPLRAWRFPVPGFKCAFGAVALNAGDLVRSVASKAKRATSRLVTRT